MRFVATSAAVSARTTLTFLSSESAGASSMAPSSSGYSGIGHPCQVGRGKSQRCARADGDSTGLKRAELRQCADRIAPEQEFRGVSRFEPRQIKAGPLGDETDLALRGIKIR